MKTILITGGAGFIGSHLADALLEQGCAVRVFDSLCEQVHGPDHERPAHLNPFVEFSLGDIRDERALREALDGVDAVFHFAALTGAAQSDCEMAKYNTVNNEGTARLLELLARHPVEKLVVASSMSVYGEGLYRHSAGSVVELPDRTLGQLKAGLWDATNEFGESLVPAATPEEKRPSPLSVYALSKFSQEQMCLLVARHGGTPATALRFFNVYGPRQSLCDPYSGVLTQAALRLLANKRPLLLEDGRQQRDFVHVHDAVAASLLALTNDATSGEAFNIGSGQRYTALEAVQHVAAVLNKGEIGPLATGKFSVDEPRHCFADISKARALLGYEPAVTLEQGLAELTDWIADGARRGIGHAVN